MHEQCILHSSSSGPLPSGRSGTSTCSIFYVLRQLFNVLMVPNFSFYQKSNPRLSFSVYLPYYASHSAFHYCLVSFQFVTLMSPIFKDSVILYSSHGGHGATVYDVVKIKFARPRPGPSKPRSGLTWKIRCAKLTKSNTEK